MPSFKDACDLAAAIAKSENFENEVIIGRRDEFSEEQLRNFPGKFVVMEELIYYTANKSMLHQTIVESLQASMRDVIARHFGRNEIRVLTDIYTLKFLNELQCHCETQKEADLMALSGFISGPSRAKLLLPAEIAYKNENLFTLLIEGFGWINQHQKYIESCILVKIFPEHKAVRIMVIYKSESGGPPKQEVLRRTASCQQGSVPLQSWNYLTPKEIIEAHFGKKIYFDHVFEEAELRTIQNSDPYPILVPVKIRNPKNNEVKELQIDVFDLLKCCADSFFADVPSD